MNNDQTADLLELADKILRTGHPWHLYKSGILHDTKPLFSPCNWIGRLDAEFEIRLALATPPDNRPLHNPDNLNAEQVGAGWRLALKGEKQPVGYQYWASVGWHNGQADGKLVDTCNKDTSIRIPLSAPWPEVEKPEPAFTLPTPPPGMQWHRLDGWQEGDLPRGWRPLVKGEEYQRNDRFMHDFGAWITISTRPSLPSADCKVCTNRPLVFMHAGKEWTWHRAGDPCPCGGATLIDVLMHGERGHFVCQNQHVKNASTWGVILGWRYTEATKEVELGPEDVPPGSVFRAPEWKPHLHITPSLVALNGVTWLRKSMLDSSAIAEYLSFNALMEGGWLINRPLSTGKWNPEAWVACSKEVPA